MRCTISTMRVFIAIDVEVNERIHQLYQALSNTGAKLKMVEPENMHLTLKFLGEVDEQTVERVKEQMRDAVADISPYTAALQGVGVFPGRQHIKVVWIGFQDRGETVALSKNIDEHLFTLGFKKERNFHPHVTIARMKSREGKDEVIRVVEAHEHTEFGNVMCDRITLKHSVLTPKGPIYSDVEVVHL